MSFIYWHFCFIEKNPRKPASMFILYFSISQENKTKLIVLISFFSIDQKHDHFWFQFFFLRSSSSFFNINCLTHSGPNFNFIFLYFRSSRSEVFLGKDVLKICSRFTGEHPCWSVISIKLLCNFIEIALRRGCSPVTILQIFRTPFSQNTSGRLLLVLEVWFEPLAKIKV